MSKKSRIIFQVALAIVTIFVVAFFAFNVSTKLERQNVASGFGFLSEEASFEISESFIEYSSFDTYGRALAVGILNTLEVAFIGNFLAIILGFFLGLALLSSNSLLRGAVRGMVEMLRNTPLLLQLFFWYAFLNDILPPVSEAFSFLGGTFSNRGLYLPYFSFSNWSWSTPQLAGFNFEGGFGVSVELLALVLGLVLYTSVFIAEIVRAGILSIDKGQWEGAFSLGLKKRWVLKSVVFPQALRVIIPPLTSQMLNLTKNSSLAVAIAFPDFVAIANTAMNQTGQAVELICLIMVMYLIFSLSTSVFMNWYNKKIMLVER